MIINEKITFIIPTIGRETLQNSINSLLNQTIKEWNAIIIFDGIKSNIMINDDRITIIENKKLGLNINSAGLVRNFGMSYAKTEWIAFLDDDDIISDDYIEVFYNEIKEYPKTDVLIYRMYSNGRIIPKLDSDNFYLCDVGISFIFKKSIYDNGLVFIPDGAEDFLYLDKIRKNGYKIMISPYTKYFIRNDKIEDNLELGLRIFINFNIDMTIILGYILINKYL
jgi:glycosyltransferase involved in cell wall biosynthesis